MRKVKTKRDTKQINCTKLAYLLLIVNIYSALLSRRPLQEPVLKLYRSNAALYCPKYNSKL